jgi:hypothetical protein
MSEKEALPVAEKNEIIVYQPEGGEFHIEVRVENETVWLTQAQMAELFSKSISVISRHIANVFAEHELEEKSNLHFLQIANSDKPVKLFSLDVIISVGYRVKSYQGTQFRRWANQVLKEHLLKGFSVNQRLVSHENRLENLDSRVIYLEKQVGKEVHDRFVIVDDVVYHVGASFKDLGNQMTAFSVLNFVTKEQVLAMVK